ncbi:ImmA/IrrE family metallo-endopeptidase [Polaromonas sp.]|uniref:ImmA/IrrE family metallo-endopeptidase n=1 Tax=Polaromonas sp. TaxID=1869339 RepID=UPI003BB5FC2A
MDNNNSVLRFEFVPAQDARRRHDGYGAGSLFLDGRPFWFSGSESDPRRFEWTWVDFLEHIAAIWPALVAEQTYPFDWLNKSASHPGEIWMRADYRWASRDEAIADEEEPVLYEFHRRHNLAAGWKGIGLPALVWLRVGNSVWLSPENGMPYRASEQECRNSLQAIGDQLAAAFEGSDNSRVVAAVLAWRLRGATLKASFLELATGFTTSELCLLQGSSSANDYWEVSDKTDWDHVPANENELLAAARMTRGVLPVPAIARVIEKIRKTPPAKTPGLDELGRKAVLHLQQGQAAYAHESGYHLAQWVREQLRVGLQRYVDIEAVLASFNVEVTSLRFDSSHIEAIAFWGLHGPCIMLNDDRAHDSHERKRMTLAHEFCHLLVDRKNALPAAEVLGGAVDQYVERRANAFAAELLLPRESVEQEAKAGNLRLSDLLLMRQKFGVSKTVACAQIYNSRVFEGLQHFEQDYVEGRIARFEAFVQREKIVSEVV